MEDMNCSKVTAIKMTNELEKAGLIKKEYQENGESASTAAKLAAKETGFKKSDIYKALLED